MNIQFSPIRSDAALNLSKMGDALTINGEVFDFSDLPEGATLPYGAVRCDMLVSDVSRIDGEVHLTLMLPHGDHASQTVRYPQGIDVQEDGDILLPQHSQSEVRT